MNIYTVNFIYLSNDLANSRYRVTDTVAATSEANACHIATRFLRKNSYTCPSATLEHEDVDFIFECHEPHIIRHNTVLIAA